MTAPDLADRRAKDAAIFAALRDNGGLAAVMRAAEEAQRLRAGIEALVADLKKADAAHFSLGLMGVRLRALLDTDPKEVEG